MKTINKTNIPKDGLAGLKENFSSDALSGLLVFFLALPLSLGIAKASDFPPIYGLITAMVGGIIVSFIAGSRLTIKGPAAGLIVIVSGAVTEFGGGIDGWHLALGAIVVGGIVQVLFGVFKLGKLTDFFPLSAVHGMLAAIGIIIISKQFHVLAGITPTFSNGEVAKEPLELLELIPNTIIHFFDNKEIGIIGFVSLLIVFGWPMLKLKITKKIPAPLVVLIVSIPLAMILGIHNVPEHIENGITLKAKTPLVNFDKGFFDILGIQVSFAGISKIGIFIKYVIMFALVGSLESLLTVKAIDMLDPYKRKSNTNKDLIAVGIGNIISGIIGGLPMISEVARSSANISNGAKTRWANFFHGVFILIFLIFAVTFSDYIPNAALAAMLIGVGYKLAHPREFGHMAKIGQEQIAIFIVTILVTISTDLLLGIGAGILLKLIIHLYNGSPVKHLFNAKTVIEGNTIHVKGCAVFSNYIGIKKAIDTFEKTQDVIFDVTTCKIVDHTVIENLHHIKEDFENEGGSFTIQGLDEFRPLSKSNHQFSAMKK
jgi:MFS superfamily sulfate permease-like transporter